MPSQTPQPKTDIILERVQFVQETVVKIENSVEKLVCKVGEFQLGYTKAHQQVVGDIEDAISRLNAHDKDIKDLRDQLSGLADVIKPLVFTNRILTWMAGIIGLGVIVFIGALLTHEVQVILH
jgi:hypothetical protein